MKSLKREKPSVIKSCSIEVHTTVAGTCRRDANRDY